MSRHDFKGHTVAIFNNIASSGGQTNPSFIIVGITAHSRNLGVQSFQTVVDFFGISETEREMVTKFPPKDLPIVSARNDLVFKLELTSGLAADGTEDINGLGMGMAVGLLYFDLKVGGAILLLAPDVEVA
jgi:hypothetical protein